MANFGKKLGAHAVDKEKTAKFTFWDVEHKPTLIVVFAGETNRPMYNDLLRRAEEMSKRKLKLNIDVIEEQRNRSRELYPLHVIRGWECTIVGADGKAEVKPYLLDDEGKPVNFTPDDCAAFIKELPVYMFNELLAFCNDPQNFNRIGNADGTAKN